MILTGNFRATYENELSTPITMVMIIIKTTSKGTFFGRMAFIPSFQFQRSSSGILTWPDTLLGPFILLFASFVLFVTHLLGHKLKGSNKRKWIFLTLHVLWGIEEILLTRVLWALLQMLSTCNRNSFFFFISAFYELKLAKKETPPLEMFEKKGLLWEDGSSGHWN